MIDWAIEGPSQGKLPHEMRMFTDAEKTVTRIGTNMRLLAICGSLRSYSTNLSVLRAVALLCPSEVEVTLYEGLAAIPAFNPDLEVLYDDQAVLQFRQALRESAGVLISTPEYAHGIPGWLKERPGLGSGERRAFRKTSGAD